MVKVSLKCQSYIVPPIATAILQEILSFITGVGVVDDENTTTPDTADDAVGVDGANVGGAVGGGPVGGGPVGGGVDGSGVDGDCVMVNTGVEVSVLGKPN